MIKVKLDTWLYIRIVFYTYESISSGSMFIQNYYVLKSVGANAIKIKMYDDIVLILQEVQHPERFEERIFIR